MKKYKIKTTQVKEKEIISITCDKCHKEFIKEDFEWNIPVHNIGLSGGYSSKYPGDLMKIDVDICEDCLQEMFSFTEPKEIKFSEMIIGNK